MVVLQLARVDLRRPDLAEEGRNFRRILDAELHLDLRLLHRSSSPEASAYLIIGILMGKTTQATLVFLVVFIGAVLKP